MYTYIYKLTDEDVLKLEAPAHGKGWCDGLVVIHVP